MKGHSVTVGMKGDGLRLEDMEVDDDEESCSMEQGEVPNLVPLTTQTKTFISQVSSQLSRASSASSYAGFVAKDVNDGRTGGNVVGEKFILQVQTLLPQRIALVISFSIHYLFHDAFPHLAAATIFFVGNINQKKMFDVCVAALLTMSFVQLLKMVIANPRPLWLSVNIKNFRARLEPDFSLPSGHSAFMVSIASATLFSFWPVRLYLLLIFIAAYILTALSRTFMANHSPQDTLWGLAVGVTVPFLTIRYDITGRTAQWPWQFQMFFGIVVFPSTWWMLRYIIVKFKKGLDTETIQGYEANIRRSIDQRYKDMNKPISKDQLDRLTKGRIDPYCQRSPHSVILPATIHGSFAGLFFGRALYIPVNAVHTIEPYCVDTKRALLRTVFGFAGLVPLILLILFASPKRSRTSAYLVNFVYYTILTAWICAFSHFAFAWNNSWPTLHDWPACHPFYTYDSIIDLGDKAERIYRDFLTQQYLAQYDHGAPVPSA